MVNLQNLLNIQSNLEWSLIFGTACWLLWCNRNKSLFDDQYVVPQDLSTLVLSRVCSFVVANQQIQVTISLNRQVKEISWQAPNPLWFKINTDGCLKQNFALAGAGRLIRNTLRGWVVGFVANLGNCSVLAVETWGILYGLHIV